jgi:hypothetical protein
MEAFHAEEIRDKACAEALKLHGEGTHRFTLQDEQGQATEDQHTCQSDNEGGYLDVRNPIPLKGTNRCTDDQRNQHGQAPVYVKFDHHDRCDRANERRHGTDRKVDPPGNDDQQHTQRHNDDIAVLQHKIGDIDRSHQDAIGLVLEEDHDRDQGDQHPIFTNIAFEENG